MLINTVLVLLQNILPIFLVVSLLLALQAGRAQSRYQEDYNGYCLSVVNLIKTTVFALIIVCLLSYYMPRLSQLFNGNGLEIVFSILFSLIYCGIATVFVMSRASILTEQHSKLTWHKKFINIVILLLVFCVHGSYFSFYLMSLTVQNASIAPLYSGIVIGVIIGTGICLSIAILLYFILLALDKKLTTSVVCYFLLIFGVGQLMQGLQLLEQVDIISSNVHLWSTRHLIAEDSELGYFLTIIFGYEATPSAMELIVYCSAIISPIVIAKFIAYQQNRQASLINGTD